MTTLLSLGESPLSAPIGIAKTVVFLAAATPICVFDLKERRIPDVLSLGGTALLLALSLLIGQEALISQIAGVLLGWGVFLLTRAVTGGKLGLGDVKFAGMMGAVVGVRWWIIAVGYAAATGLLTALVLLGTGRIDRETRIPFAPFLTAGTVGAILTHILS